MKNILLSAIAVVLTLPAHAGYFPQWVSTGISQQQAETWGVEAADFNSDGRPDTIALSGKRRVVLTPTDADGKPGTPATIWTAEGTNDIAVADFDGDGKKDVVIAAPNVLVFLRSTGDGTFAAAANTFLDFSPWGLAAEDFTGDGVVDVAVWGYYANTVAVLRGNGSGAFTEATRTTVAPSWFIEAGDVDGDDRMDLLVERVDPPSLELFYGKGNGTFEAPVSFPKPKIRWLAHYRILDVDVDGDGEILYLDTDADTLSVLVNLGSRTFAAPAVYSVFIPGEDGSTPSDVAATDVDGDGKLDLIVALGRARRVVTFPGNGNGSFGSPVVSLLMIPGVAVLPRDVVSADFTGDGRADFAVGYGSGVAIFRNATGDVVMRVTPRYPVLSVGQSAAFRVSVDKVGLGIPIPFDDAPSPTGAVTLKRGSEVLGGGVAPRFEVEGVPLPLGTHAIAAHYAGDESFHSAVSSEAVQKVVAEKTTTTLGSGVSGPTPYGTSFGLTVSVASELGGDVSGMVTVFKEGVPVGTMGVPWPSYFYPKSLSVGTHTYQAEYEGNATQPPSRSNLLTLVITKAQTTTKISFVPPTIAAGNPVPITMLVLGQLPEGWVRVYEGTKLLAKAFVRYSDVGTLHVTLPPFTTEGTHQLHATYAGDENHEPSVSAVETVVVTAGTVTPRRRLVRP